MKTRIEWRHYRLWFRGGSIQFWYNILTRQVKAPGFGKFTAQSLEDARNTLIRKKRGKK